MSSSVETQSVVGEPGLSPLAGKPAPKELLIDVARLEREYFERHPDPVSYTHLTLPTIYSV